MKKSLTLFLFFMFIFFSVNAQKWKLKITSSVELREWKLTSKADIDVKPLIGASVKVFKLGVLIAQAVSDGNGDFKIMVPANGVFILEVSYASCSVKRFEVSTLGVPAEVSDNADFSPTFTIGGFVLSKPFKEVDYSELASPLVKVYYSPKIKNFNYDHATSDAGLNVVATIYSAEKVLINNFCSTNKLGDAALTKKDCPLAKSTYEKAITIIYGEQYPIEQLQKCDICFAEKLETEKKVQEKINKDVFLAESLKTDQLLKVKAATETDIANKLEKEKVIADKAIKKKIEAAKVMAVKPEKEKVLADNAKDLVVTAKEKKKEKEIAPAIKPTVKNELKKNSTTNESPSSKYKVPQILDVAKYDKCMLNGDDFLALKKYKEAMACYKAALKIKQNDAVAIKKLNEIDLIINPRKN